MRWWRRIFGGAADGGTKAARVVERDPVCGMRVTVGESTLRSERAERTFYFCCPRCKQAFDQRPEAYVHA